MIRDITWQFPVVLLHLVTDEVPAVQNFYDSVLFFRTLASRCALVNETEEGPFLIANFTCDRAAFGVPIHHRAALFIPGGRL